MLNWIGARHEVAVPRPAGPPAFTFFWRGCLVGLVLGACSWTCVLVSIARALAGP